MNKHINRYALTLTTAALLCGAAVAQERAQRPAQPVTQNSALKAGDVQATNLIGAEVKSTSGQAIGEVEDLIVSSTAGVRLAVISVGGLLGVGDKKIALPYQQFSVAPDGRTLYLNMSEDELKAKPAFDADPDHAAVAADRTAQPQRSAAPAVPAARPAAPAPAASDRAASAPQRPSSGGARTLKASEQPASSLIGAAVVDSKDSKIGKIHDLIVSAGKQGVQAILALGGGVGGLGARMVAVPLDDLTIQRDADENRRHEPDRVQTALTVSQLEGLPEFHYE